MVSIRRLPSLPAAICTARTCFRDGGQHSVTDRHRRHRPANPGSPEGPRTLKSKCQVQMTSTARGDSMTMSHDVQGYLFRDSCMDLDLLLLPWADSNPACLAYTIECVLGMCIMGDCCWWKCPLTLLFYRSNIDARCPSYQVLEDHVYPGVSSHRSPALTGKDHPGT